MFCTQLGQKADEMHVAESITLLVKFLEEGTDIPCAYKRYLL